jgi:hypothetical protein
MTSFKKGQSLVEFAVMLPLLLVLLLGVVEVVIFVGTYINLIDLTREAARYASTNDPFDPLFNGDKDCRTNTGPGALNFYYDISCVFSPLANPDYDLSNCTLDTNICKWHDGFNSTETFNSATDDILVTVYTVTDNVVTDNWPKTGPWVWSNNDYDTAHSNNWQRSCDGTNPTEIAAPLINAAYINNYMESGSQPSKGFVVVEAFFCYYQVLGAPIISQLLPNPVKLHVYTIMPLPAAQPSATPKPH